MQHIAQEGRCFVITANQYHAPQDFPPDYPANAADPATKPKGADGNPDVWSRGGSAIVGPLGDVLAGPLWDKEGIIYADVSHAHQGRSREEGRWSGTRRKEDGESWRR